MKKYTNVGLDCANCAQKIEDKLNKLDEVKECTIQFASSTLFIDASDELTDKRILNVIQSVEPDASLEEKGKKHHKSHDHKHHHEHEECCCDHEHHHEHEECSCGHEHHHEHEECSCGHEHHHEHEKCSCGHEHHHEHEECSCGHERHHEHEECSCGHEHHHHEKLPERHLDQAISFSIKGLDCANCAMKVEKKINELDYIDKAVLNFSTEVLLVKSNENDLQEKLQKVIDSVESGVTLSLNKNNDYEKPKLFDLKENVDLIAGIIVYIASILLNDLSISIIGYIVAYFLIGHEVLLKAFKNILRREVFDENFLMCIATIGAFAIGEYREAVAVLLFYSIGEIFQAYAVNKTRGSISQLMDIKSEYANLLVDGEIQKIEPDEVNVDNIIVVKVGEKVPLDGIVVKGQSTLDTSSLTGESIPRNIDVNDEILAGVVNLTEVIQVKVTKPYEDSTVAKIIDLMENAASKKAPIERFITKFARVYTPTVVFAAIALAIIPMILFEDAVFTDWLYRALTFLVVSCPCALVISIPLGLYAGLGKASKIGALIKGGNYLELLKDIDTVVFDKTGTLTKGTFKVVEINGDDSLLEIAALGEAMSNHPISRSIIKEYKNDIDYSRISGFKEIAGKGIEVLIDNQKYYLGNKSYLDKLSIEAIEPETVGTIVYIACENKYLGNIVVADEIKETTKNGIFKLKRAGIKETVMLTGDHHSVANDVASKLTIDTVYSELLPQDKVTQVEKLLNSNKKVAFVGDGINDAPVLARANVGIAMGGVGSDAAIEAADMVLMQDNIETIAEAIEISKKTHGILIQNVTFTLVIKIGVLILTMFGYSNMWMGVFADVGVTLIAILNSMRILR